MNFTAENFSAVCVNKIKGIAKKVNFKTVMWNVLKEGTLCKISSTPNL